MVSGKEESVKTLWSIVLVAAILAGLFGPPTPWPDGLDELVTFIDTEQPGWTFSGECGAGTLVTWARSTATLGTVAGAPGVEMRADVLLAALVAVAIAGAAGATVGVHEELVVPPSRVHISRAGIRVHISPAGNRVHVVPASERIHISED
jgi:hypothetical protein